MVFINEFNLIQQYKTHHNLPIFYSKNWSNINKYVMRKRHIILWLSKRTGLQSCKQFENHIYFLIFQSLFAITFKAIVFIHCFELIYATYRCLSLGLTLPTMVKWLISVSLNGVFALKMLHDPEKFYNVVKKEKSNWRKIE